MKAVVDTNVIVSSFLSLRGSPAQIVERWLEGTFKLVVSEAILEEYQRSLGYERARKRHSLTSAEIGDAVDHFRESGILVETGEALDVISADPDDNKFLECAVAGGADYIVSGDTHLLNLRQYQGIEIVAPAIFLALLEQENKP